MSLGKPRHPLEERRRNTFQPAQTLGCAGVFFPSSFLVPEPQQHHVSELGRSLQSQARFSIIPDLPPVSPSERGELLLHAFLVRIFFPPHLCSLPKQRDPPPKAPGSSDPRSRSHRPILPPKPPGASDRGEAATLQRELAELSQLQVWGTCLKMNVHPTQNKRAKGCARLFRHGLSQGRRVVPLRTGTCRLE